MAMAVALLSGCAAKSSRPSGQKPQAEQPSGSGGGQEASRSGLGHPVLGDVSAPVVMVEYGDFQ
jgi:protein-disulfide isomerase